MSVPRPVLGVGVLGAGTVGSQVIRILQSSREDFALVPALRWRFVASSSAMWMLRVIRRLIASC